jgi:hypothetical protein
MSVGLETLMSPSPKNMDLLLSLGVPAAELNVNNRDFEAKFDLQPS